MSFVVSNFDHKALDTRKTIKHIGLSCDDLTISVVYEEDGSLCIGCFDVRCFEKPVSIEPLSMGAENVELLSTEEACI